eukprot:CAMPEP_0195289764 /NCGR_PEP_ID=MMETSP0707-20130614/5903_1 /TAXON_ID=33640 /ORGANISM="Asterionellopsis glacialis, Strain CCMP134" /LENGTH=966 /DNA_ID=CAMNT_0040349807 /DNA_START=583 /DNA_END=3483 /DNA_ORIENTATION=+
MSVRTRIRSFEQQNEEVAKKTFSPSKNIDPFPPSNYREDSPARTSGSSSSNASNNKNHPPVTIRKSSPASRKNAMSASPSPSSKQNTSTSSLDSKSKTNTLGKKAVVMPSKNGALSPTMMKVKQNRKSRIQRETSNSSKSPSPSPPVVAGSLKQRRNLMKYQKQRAREQQQEQLDNNNGIGVGSGSLSGSHHSADSGISSGRRFVHSISQESSGEINIESSVVVPQQRLPHQKTQRGGGTQQEQQHHNYTYDSPTRYTSAQIAKSHRMQRMRNNSNNINHAANTGKDPPAVMSPPHGGSNNYRDNHEQQQQQSHGRGQPHPYETSTTGPAPASPVLYAPSEEDNTEFNSVCKSPKLVDDDDATLTSVRQIMGGADHQPTTSSSLMSGVTSSTMQQTQPTLQPKRYFNHDTVSSPKNSDFVANSSSKNGRNGNMNSGAEESTSFLKKKKLSRGSGHSSRGGRSSRGSNNNVLMKAASSTDYDSDGGEDRRVEVKRNKNKSRSRNEATDSAMDVFLQKTRSSRVEEDERTFDYGELNDSVASFDTANRHALKQANVNHDGMKSTAFVKEEPRPLLVNNEDLEFYTKNMNTPVAKTTAGVVAAATVGAVVMGPVGLLVGAAAVGIAVGAMQVPEEQRENVKEKVTAGVVQASDALSVSCVTMCHQTGVAEHIPPEVARCYDPDVAKEFEESKKSGGTGADGTVNGTGADGTVNGTGIGGGVSYNASMNDNENPNNGKNIKGQDDKNHDKQSHTSGAGNNIVNNAMRGLMPDNHGNKAPLSRGAMCLRDVRIIPVSQIYGLQPSQQPRAWLDVMACAHTSMDEKNEAMEEICIIAKDKNNAAVLLQEGILDSLIWILTRHLEKLKRDDNKVSARETSTAKLAASCCVTLGKAHCALVHTGGDLLLMSMYEHGKVPEERQLAQMLYETPHHHPVVTDPLSSSGQEQFAIKTLAMHEAQELARSIKPLTDEW